MKLKKNDPDFFYIFNNFNNKEILGYVSISKRTRFVITLATLITNTSKEKYAIAVRDALEVLTPIEIKEVLYQAVAYVGLGKTFELFEVTNDVLLKNSVDLPLESISTVNKDNRYEKGLEIQKQFFLLFLSLQYFSKTVFFYTPGGDGYGYDYKQNRENHYHYIH